MNININTFDYDTMSGFAWITFGEKEYTVQCCLAPGSFNEDTGNCLPCQTKIIMSDCGHNEGICGETNKEAFDEFGEDMCMDMLFEQARKHGLEIVDNSRLIELALNSIRERQIEHGSAFNSPGTARNLCQMRMAQEDIKQEHFLVLYLDNQHKLIKDRVEFHGTVDGACVHPRVIAQHALEYNALALIFCHNHPSGISKPSQADKDITTKLKNALSLFDIRVLDHLIIGNEVYSFAYEGLL